MTFGWCLRLADQSRPSVLQCFVSEQFGSTSSTREQTVRRAGSHKICGRSGAPCETERARTGASHQACIRRCRFSQQRMAAVHRDNSLADCVIQVPPQYRCGLFCCVFDSGLRHIVSICWIGSGVKTEIGWNRSDRERLLLGFAGCLLGGLFEVLTAFGWHLTSSRPSRRYRVGL